MSVFAEPLAQVRHVIAYLARQSASADIDGTAPQDEGFAALDLIEQRAKEIETALRAIAEMERWVQAGPLIDIARAALSAREEAS